MDSLRVECENEKGKNYNRFLQACVRNFSPLSIGKFKTSFKNNFFPLTKERSIENVMFHDIED